MVPDPVLDSGDTCKDVSITQRAWELQPSMEALSSHSVDPTSSRDEKSMSSPQYIIGKLVLKHHGWPALCAVYCKGPIHGYPMLGPQLNSAQ